MMPVGRRRRPRRHGRAHDRPGGRASSPQNMFAAGAARLVIGAQMPRERAAMHLDTVFTFCDRDVVTIYEPVVDADPADPLHARTATAASRPRSRSARSSTRSRTRSGIDGPEARHDRRRRVRGRAQPVGRRQQRRRARARRRRRLRAQRGDQREARQGRRRGARDRRPGARPRPRRRPLHDLPDRPRRLRRSTTMSTVDRPARPAPAEAGRLLSPRRSPT